MLPESLLAELEGRFGPIRVGASVGGGCINPAVRVEAGGKPLFLKYNTQPAQGFFAAEAEGLDLIRATGAIRVPEVLAFRDTTERLDSTYRSTGWILLEWLESVRPSPEHWDRLGRRLATLHRATGDWGLERDGFIGPLRQANGPTPDWPSFWRDRRLEPQLRLASSASESPGSEADWDRLFHALPELLAPAESDGASLLHGDLWSGNVLALASGEPAVVDPAAYHGHREVDLAMADLFGGFGGEFRRAYEDEWPLQPAYDLRKRVYQLYYLLVHVNLFGGAYRERTRRLLASIISRT